MAILHHGTTRKRAEQIVAFGPDLNFIEPGSGPGMGMASFSSCLEGGPFPLGPPQVYACAKAALFPKEGGPAIVWVDVPDDIIALATRSEYFPLRQGVIQFDEGEGLEELQAEWPKLPKGILEVECP